MPRAWSSALIGLCLLASPAAAQSDYPSKPVKIIVPSAPGGGPTIAARVLAQHLSQAMGQQFFIDNRPGAGNMIGIERSSLGARRLHLADDGEHAQHQSAHLQEGAVRCGAGLRADLAGGVAAQRAGGPPRCRHARSPS